MTPARCFGRFLLLAGLWVSACHGQELWDTLSQKTGKAGFHLYGVSAYVGTSSATGPVTVDQNQYLPVNTNLGGDTTYGVQLGLGWLHSSAKTTASIQYSGSYGGQVHYSNVDSFGHHLSFDLNRQFGTKWTVSLLATGDYRTLTQYLFEPTALGVVSQLPGTASDLAAAFSVGSFSNATSAAIFSGTSTIDSGSSPARTLLLADRILTYQVSASATYATTSRLTLHFSSVSAGGQQSFDNNSKIVLPRTLGLQAGLSFSYALTPRTNFGVEVSEFRTQNQFQDAYSTTGSVRLSRMMGMHWFFAVNGGMTYSAFGKQSYGTPPSTQTIGGATLGYRFREHTLAGSYYRSAIDAYGGAVGVNTRASGTWQWSPPGSSWRVSSSITDNQIRNTGFISVTGWRASAGFSKTMSRQFSLSFDYGYAYSAGAYLNILTNRTFQSARVTIRWHPEGVPRSGYPDALRSPFDAPSQIP
jgi:hypothetical protein